MRKAVKRMFADRIWTTLYVSGWLFAILKVITDESVFTVMALGMFGAALLWSTWRYNHGY